MNFFSAFYKSLFNVTWLKDQRTRAGRAWGYFFLLIGVISIFYSVPIIITLPSALREVTRTVEKNIPDNFKAEVKSGELAVSGFVQPLTIRGQDKGNFIAVIDTVATSTKPLASFLRAEDQGGVLVARDRIELYNPPRSQIVYMKDIADTTVTKADLVRVTRWLSGSGALVIISILLIITVLIVVIIWKLWVVFLAVLIATIVSAVFHRGWKFGELFVMGLYAITLPSVISFILFALGIWIAWIHFIIMLAFMLAIVLMKTVSASSMPSSKDTSETPSLS